MSASRCIKLLQMMGLHRLDDPNAEFEMMPTLLPPKDWIELEGTHLSSLSKSYSILTHSGYREEKNILGRVFYRLSRFNQHRMAFIN